MSIIHVSGPSGSGKTCLGNKLKEYFKSKIIVKDIDDLRIDFIKKNYGNKKFDVIDKVEYQKYIDDFVKKHSSKPLIFVGLNHMPWWHINHYYDLHSTYNYFIDLDDETIIKQKYKRLLLVLANDDEYTEMLVSNNVDHIKKVLNIIKQECDLKKMIKMNNKWRKDYKNQGYKFMTRENIYKSVVKILNNNF